MSALMAPAELEARLGSASLIVLDTRSGADGAGMLAFQGGHIPGARHTDYVADGWRQRVGDVPGLLPDTAHLTQLVARLGLAPSDGIVIVPEGKTANDLAAAARIYWTLKVSGLNPIAILDGGMMRWTSEGRAMETGAARLFATTPGAITPDPSFRATADEVSAGLASGEALIDGRAPSYWRGDEEAAEAKAAGHIPGAVNVDYVTAFDPTKGRLKPLPELEKLYAGLKPGPVVSYCNTGHTAALNWFVLSEVLGRQGVRLYDGSMTDWTQDPARPVRRQTP